MNDVGLRAGDVRRAADLGAKLRGAPGFQDLGTDGVFDIRDGLPAGLVAGLPATVIERMRWRRSFGAAWMHRAGSWARHCTGEVSP